MRLSGRHWALAFAALGSTLVASSPALARSDAPGTKVESAPAAPLAASASAGVSDLLLSISADRSSPVPLAGQTVGGTIYVFVANDPSIQRVRFFLDDPAMSGAPRQIEGTAPWDFAGSVSTTTAKPFDTRQLAQGGHTITAAVDLKSGITEVGSATFTVAGGFEIVSSSSPTRAGPIPLAGQTVTGNLYAFTQPDSGVSQVRFFLDDPAMTGLPRRVEVAAPFDFAGTATGGSATPFDTTTIANGSHTITAALDLSAGGTRTISSSFTVSNLIPLAFTPVSLSFTGPQGGTSAPKTASLNAADGSAAGFSVSDDASWLTVTPTSGTTPATLTVAVDLAGLARGSYSAKATARASGYRDAVLAVTLTVDPDAIPPAAPANVTATAGDRTVTLGWSANSELDLAGYNVYRGTSQPVSTAGAPLNGTTLLTVPAYGDTGLTNGTTYYYVVEAVDTGGNKAAAAPVAATPQASNVVDLKVNFQSESAPVPAGYLRDFGEAYGPRSGANQGSGLSYGWVVPGTRTPVSLVGTGRDRNVDPDQRLDTFVHMQHATLPQGAWELAVPNGAYTVSVSVGDAAGYTDSRHRINIEGQVAIYDFVPTKTNKYASVTRTVDVADGALTVDAQGGANTKIDYATIVSDATATSRPSVTGVSPANGATEVARNSFVAAEVRLPNAGYGIDEATLTSSTVLLTRASDGAQVPANLNTSGGGDVIVLQPTVPLDATTSYRFDVTDGLKDLSGAAFLPFGSTFTTGTGGSTPPSSISFEKVALATAAGRSFTSVAVGPDGKLYAGTIDGDIVRFPLNPDGTTGVAEVIDSIRVANGGPRSVIGLAFDPTATATNPILWVSHSVFAFNNAPDWTGKVSRLSGASLGTVQDFVVGLPRSIRDHMTNSLAFGPDGALYLVQGSNTAMGAPDDAWGNRPEHLLNAAVLRVDPAGISSPPLDVKTEEGGSYDPFASGAPVTVYASGLRNAYDLVWHSNGQLYVPTNGSAGGGNTPGTPSPLPGACATRIDAAVSGLYTGPSVPGLTNVPSAQPDFLFRVVKGGYYGHPNPTRCEWVMNGGNPTSAVDKAEVAEYPLGVAPDRNWRGNAFDFGKHYSPDGVIEYHGNAFGGALEGKLLVARYSAGDDIILLTPGGTSLNIVGSETGVTGLTGFVDPLDLAEDPATGYVYVTELGAQRITLLRPGSSTGAPRLRTDVGRLLYNDVQGGAASQAQTLTITNAGDRTLTLGSLALAGTNPGQFAITRQPALPAAVDPGGSVEVDVVFNPGTTGPKSALLRIGSDDPNSPQTDVKLRGLGTLGLGGSNEPSLQWILDTYEIPVNVGDPDPTTSALPTTALLGDEVSAQRFEKSDTGPVTVDPIAVFGPQSSAGMVLRFGRYGSGKPGSKQELFTVPNASYQSVNPATPGDLDFDPGTSRFGFYATWPFFSNRDTFSEDSLNTFTGALPHHARVYPLKASDGSVVANAYVVAFEDATTATDYQDIVAIVRNVRPAPVTGPQLDLENLDGVPFDDRLVFSRIGTLTSPPPYGVHELGTVRLVNRGLAPLTIGGLTLTGTWAFTSPITLPAIIPAGGTLDVGLRFTAASGGVANGSLAIQSDDPQKPTTTVLLSGYWQSVSEGNQEPSLTNVLKIFGYQTVIVGAGQKLNEHGLVHAVGDEVLSPYWRRADTTQPLRIRQLAAYHTQNTVATLRLFGKGSTTISGLLQHKADNSQTVLPLKNSTTGEPAAVNYTPGPAVFGFMVDGESSDDTQNNQTADVSGGCPGPCGHHVRFWPVRDRAGRIVPDTWFLAMDYAGINYDYNDNVYLIANMKPEDPAVTPGSALYRLDVAGTADYVDTSGHTWTPDTGLFSPSTAIAEGADVLPQTIAGTNNSPIYRTYRGNVGSVPLDQRVLRYSLPVTGTQKVDLRLHFAERYSGNNAPGKRLFDVRAEGRLVADDFDIFAASGGVNTAYVLRVDGVSVADGALNLVFRAVVDYPSIAGIEVLCQGFCSGVDTTPPAAPTGLSAAAGEGKVTLAWTPNTEADLAGYNVYRSTSLPVPTSGAALNGSTLLKTAGYTDTAVVNGTTYYYVVQAVDTSGNKAVSGAVAATPRDASTFAVKVNFQSETAPVPAGYLRDYGQGYGPRTAADQGGETFGWVAPGTTTPTSLVGFGRDRNLLSDQRLDTLVHMQPATASPGSWEIAVPNGSYTVTISVGDQVAIDSVHRISAEGQPAVDFTPTSGNRFATAVKVVSVADGRLTLEPTGTNTKVNYVWVAGDDGTAPAQPTGLTASGSSAGVDLDWADSSERDLGGYNVYRAASAGGPFTKLNGALLQSSAYSDAGAPQGSTSYYQVTAVDIGGHESSAATAQATRPASTDPTAVTWSTVAPSPIARHEAGGAVVNGKLYVFGGFSSGSSACPPATVGSCISVRSDVYDPAGNSWTQIADMPEGVTHAGVATDGTNVYVAGGYVGTVPNGTQTFGTTHVWKYSVAANTWSSMTPLPQARGSGNLAVVGRSLHFFGGADLSRADRTEHWILDLDAPTSWVVSAPMLDPATHRGSAVVGGKIYAVGGQKGVDASAVTQRTLQMWDPASPGAWTQLAPLPAVATDKGRSHIAAGTFDLNGRLVVLGGDSSYQTAIRNVTSYNPSTNAWTELTPLPLSRESAVAGVVAGNIYATTGSSSSTTFKGVPSGP